MNPGTRLLLGMASCAGLMMPACTVALQPAVTPAFFTAAPQDRDAVQVFAREQERQVQICAAARACDRAHYLRALAALYEDRRVATKHFQATVAESPNGPYAASSFHWIRLLEINQDAARDPDLMHVTDQVVREVFERERAVRQAAMRLLEPKPGEAILKDAQAVQSLTRQLKEREKKIDELTQQIDALKRVDQEVKDRVKSKRPAN